MAEINATQLARLHATVEGRVQGVGFRAFVEQSAEMLNLRGWVRNRWDGSVEVTAEGERQDLEKLLAALWRGPRASGVADVRFEWLTATGEFAHFSVRMTG
jgi:acylphosphatase